jgi:hypothetical protein
VFAAALGDLAAVEGHFDAGGRLKSDVSKSSAVGVTARYIPPDRIVDYALIQAAAHNRRQTVEFLLTKDPDLEFREPFFDATARGVARYMGHEGIVALLDARTVSGSGS